MKNKIRSEITTPDWMTELADETFDKAWKDTMKEMRPLFRKSRIEKIFK